MTATSTQASQSAGGSGTRTDATFLTAAGVHIAYEEQGDPHRRRASQGEEEKEQHRTTWSIDCAFMIDTGDLCTREEVDRIGWDMTRDTVLVSEDLATGGIRAHLDCPKGNRHPWIAGKIEDDIEEFGHGVALVRIKSDQETAIVDVQGQ